MNYGKLFETDKYILYSCVHGKRRRAVLFFYTRLLYDNGGIDTTFPTQKCI